MSLLLRNLRSSRAPSCFSRNAATFHTSSARRALSESDRKYPSILHNLISHHPITTPPPQRHAPLLSLTDPQVQDADRSKKIDEHKHDSLNKQQKGEGEWKPELSSNSEQAVAGDKHEMSMEEMQKMGQKRAEEGKQPSGSK